MNDRVLVLVQFVVQVEERDTLDGSKTTRIMVVLSVELYGNFREFVRRV